MSCIGIFASAGGGDAPAGRFQIEVDTTKAGSASDTFVLPLAAGPTYDVTVAWGDGSSDSFNTSGNKSHTYSASGTYTVSVKVNSGSLFIKFNAGGDRLKVMKLKNWGEKPWYSFNGAFRGCSNMTITATDGASVDLSICTDLDDGWRDCASITSFPTWDTSAITTAARAWLNCSSLTSFPTLDLSGVASLASTWNGCSSLTSFPSGMDLTGCTNFDATWYGCTGLTSFPALNLSAGTWFGDTWNGCSGLTSFGAVNVSSGTTFNDTWNGCTGLAGYAFPTLTMRNMTSGARCFNGWGMSTAAYNALLVELANTVNNSVGFSGGTSHYDSTSGGNDGVTAHNHLTGTHSWTITDGGTP